MTRTYATPAARPADPGTPPPHDSMEEAQMAARWWPQEAEPLTAPVIAQPTDGEMLDWVLEQRATLVELREGGPVYVHYWNSRERHGPDASTPRDAVRLAMKQHKKAL